MAEAPAKTLVDLDQLEDAIAHDRLIQAEAMIKNATLAQQKDPRLDLLMADFALARGQNEIALAGYQPLLTNDSFKARAAEGAGLAALRLGHDEAASGYLKQATALDKSRARAWDALGIIADLKKDWKASGVAYRAALTAAPNDPAILNNMGYSMLLQRRYALAIDLFQSAQKLRPADEMIETNLNFALALSGQYAAAIGNDTNAETLAGRLNNAGFAAYLRRDNVAARAFLSRAIEIRDVYYLRAANNLSLIPDGRKGNMPK